MPAAPLAESVRADYERHGFCRVPDLVDPELLPGATAAMDRVIAGDYATGITPMAVNWRPGDDPARLVKIDQPQMADPSITELFRRSRIGEVAAALTGAAMVQVWAVQLLYKPSGAGTAVGNVGWHQDDDYWSEWWDGEVFTCWLALSDVTPESGPMQFVPGSHGWGFLARGNFFAIDIDGTRQQFPVPAGSEWREEPAVLPAGGGSFHHRQTIHGSGPNTSGSARRSYAVHLRTDRSAELPSAPEVYRGQLRDPAISPILFER